MWRRLLLSALSVSWLAQVAEGQVYRCVDDQERAWAAGECCGGPAAENDQSPDPSIADALAAATSRGQDATVICVGSDLQTESVSLDFSGGEWGDEVRLFFSSDGDVNYCASAAEEFSVTGPGGGATFEIQGLRTSTAVCGALDSFLQAESTSVSLQNIRAKGGTGGRISVGPSSGCVFALQQSRLDGWSEGGLTSACDLTVERTELASMSGASPIIETSDGASLSLNRSALFGNAVSGSPLVRVDGVVDLSGSVLAENVVVGGVLVLVSGAGGLHRIERSTFSGNSLLAEGTAVAAPLVERGLATSSFCLPDGADDLPYLGRQGPVAEGVPGDVALVEFEGQGIELRMWKSAFLGSVRGPESVLVRAGGFAQRLLLLNNTFDESGPALDLNGGQAFGAARNLWSGAATVQTSGGWGSYEHTMDVFADKSSTWENAFAGAVRLEGPFPELLPFPPYRSAVSEYSEVSECERIVGVCPDVDASLCDDPNALRSGNLACALHEGVNVRLDPDFPDSTRPAWPWDTSVVADALRGAPENRFGMEGGRCGFEPWVTDDLLPGGGQADGDGYSSLTDCGNEDGSVVPVVPSRDGLDGGECVATPCWTCPDGSEAGTDPDSLEVPVGCTGRGCGFAFPIALLPLLWWPLRRR